MEASREIRLIEAEDGWWSAIDAATGVASQGTTQEEALENFNKAMVVTADARTDDTLAPEPDAPWFDA